MCGYRPPLTPPPPPPATSAIGLEIELWIIYQTISYSVYHI